MVALPVIKRRHTKQVTIDHVKIGGNAPILVQSMTNTDTADINATTAQIKELADAGSEIVRITVDRDDSAKAVAAIKENLLKSNYNVPLAGCFHYNGHYLLEKYQGCAENLSKYRINPGNVGFAGKHDLYFESIIKMAIKYDKAVRLGVNWGSLDKEISQKLMDENARRKDPKSADEILREALIQSALISAADALKIGLAPNKIILSCKVSRVQDLVSVYRELSARSDYALHLGLTEAGSGSKGIVASSAALAILLQEGIGDTIRVSLTPEPNASRSGEVIVAQEILQTMGLRSFAPMVSACPGCGRTTSTFFIDLADKIQSFLRQSMQKWKKQYLGVENMNVAVMGCIVNGPGESKHANIGISLPGNGEDPIAPVFIDGEKFTTLRGHDLAEQFQAIVEDYVARKYSKVP